MSSKHASLLACCVLTLGSVLVDDQLTCARSPRAWESVAPVSAQGAAQLRRQPGVPLAEQVDRLLPVARAAGTTIQVVEHIDPALPVTDKRGRRLPFLALNDVVAIVQIGRLESRPTHDRSWLESDVIATITDIWRTTEAGGRLAPSIGSAVTFPFPGGMVEIEGVPVQATIEGFRSLQEGGRYLIFGHEADDGSLAVGLGEIFPIDGDKVQAIAPKNPPDDVAGRTLNKVKRGVLSATK